MKKQPIPQESHSPAYYPTSRWVPLREHIIQHQLWNCSKRFIVNPAGRRSGKTELAKRKLIKRAMNYFLDKSFPSVKYEDPRFFAAAPTRDQAKRIYWDDLKRLTPRWAQSKHPNESEMAIYLTNGATIFIVGMDKPERIEGSPWDGGILDEFGNMKKQAWGEHVRPALADRNGWCDLIGVPEGRNHYYDVAKEAQANESGEWAYYHWFSSDILPQSEIDAAKKDLDELVYQQEYEGSFINFTGRTYYPYQYFTHQAKILYDKKQPLIFCLDFNVAPGVAVVLQEKPIKDISTNAYLTGETATGVIGEVYIPRNSNTVLVCNKLINDWGNHQGRIAIYGDATGGSKGTAKLGGTDWDLVRQSLGRHFGDRLLFNVAKSNPSERDRVNSVNSRLKTMDGKIRLYVDPSKAPHVVKDFEGVQCVEGGSGEIDKKKSPELTHLTDAIGYYIHQEFPVRKIGAGMAVVKGV
ncbi:MAG: terminase family protein [Sulfuricurvum sp.]|nr:terminase family protein [Sulfuricurvum sp.]